MSMLKQLSSDESISNEKDSVGFNGPLDSAIYKSSISLAYLQKSDGGALGLVLNAKTADGREIRQTLWMTSGTAKGCKNFYVDKEGAKHYLPGFNLANSLALLTTGKEISELDTETKVVNVYSAAVKGDVPTKVEMVMDLLGKDINIGLLKQTVDKTAKVDGGGYEPTGETRDENEIDKFFRARDNMTTAELRAEATEAVFAATWTSKWVGQVRNKATVAKGSRGTAGAPKVAGAIAGAAKKPANSLFA
jgi:hypothetical protein